MAYVDWNVGRRGLTRRGRGPGTMARRGALRWGGVSTTCPPLPAHRKGTEMQRGVKCETSCLLRCWGGPPLEASRSPRSLAQYLVNAVLVSILLEFLKFCLERHFQESVYPSPTSLPSLTLPPTPRCPLLGQQLGLGWPSPRGAAPALLLCFQRRPVE